MVENDNFSEKKSNLQERLVDLVRRGRKIEAVKLFRQETGASLKDAKETVEFLTQAKPTPVQGSQDQVIALLREGKRIPAIKAYRLQTGVGLKEAKEAVDALAQKHGITLSGSGCALIVGVAIVLLFLIIALQLG